jgi:hypothetical protein
VCGDLHAQSEQNSFVIDGIAVIENNNIAAARVAAIQDAQKKAINQYISGLVPSDLIVSNYKILEEHIFSKIVNFVSSYKVLSESRDGNIYRTSVEVFITVDTLQKALAEAGLIFTRGEYPRVLIMISEETADGNFDWWWNRDTEIKKGICGENIANKIKQRGFVFIEPEVVRQKLENDASAQNMDLSIDTIRKIGRDNGADIVIYGKGTLRKGEDVEGSTLKSYYAKLLIKALYIETGKTVFEAEDEAGGLNIVPEVAVKNAYKKVSDVLGEKIVDAIEKFWKEEVIKAQNIFIEIKNPEKLDEVLTLLPAIQKIKNVRRAELRAFSQDSSLIEAEIFNITLESLAAQIMSNLELQQKYQVLSIKSDRIVFIIKDQSAH